MAWFFDRVTGRRFDHSLEVIPLLLLHFYCTSINPLVLNLLVLVAVWFELHLFLSWKTWTVLSIGMSFVIEDCGSILELTSAKTNCWLLDFWIYHVLCLFLSSFFGLIVWTVWSRQVIGSRDLLRLQGTGATRTRCGSRRSRARPWKFARTSPTGTTWTCSPRSRRTTCPSSRRAAVSFTAISISSWTSTRSRATPGICQIIPTNKSFFVFFFSILIE
jgi:hypothetical protein